MHWILTSSPKLKHKSRYRDKVFYQEKCETRFPLGNLSMGLFLRNLGLEAGHGLCRLRDAQNEKLRTTVTAQQRQW